MDGLVLSNPTKCHKGYTMVPLYTKVKMERRFGGIVQAMADYAMNEREKGNFYELDEVFR